MLAPNAQVSTRVSTTRESGEANHSRAGGDHPKNARESGPAEDQIPVFTGPREPSNSKAEPDRDTDVGYVFRILKEVVDQKRCDRTVSQLELVSSADASQ